MVSTPHFILKAVDFESTRKQKKVGKLVTW